MDKSLRNAIIAGIIIIALSFGYYLVVFLPKKEAMRIEQQKQEVEQQKQEQEANVLKEQEKADKEKQIRDNCYNEAKDKARELLKKKIDMGLNAGGATLDEMKKAYDQGLSFHEDSDRYYEECLSKNGLKK